MDHSSPNHCKVLVVDDDSDFCALIKRALAAGGSEVETVFTAADAEAKFVPPYDLVILDLKLPDKPGLQVLHHIRKFSPSLPVLIVSGSYKSPGPLDPATFFSDKLTDIDALSRVINSHIEKIKAAHNSTAGAHPTEPELVS
jgi:DNA-binding NtrC family response regulator